MSKITTVVKVMEEMKKEENKKMHITGQLTAGDEVLVTVDREVERGQKGGRRGNHDFRGHEGREGRPHGMRRADFGRGGHGPNEEGFMNKLRDLGFSTEEIEKLKSKKENFRKNRPNPKDRIITGLKMLDRMEESSDGESKILTLEFTNDDLPDHVKEMRQAAKDQAFFTERLRKAAEAKGHADVDKFAERMGHRADRAQMKEVKEALEAKGIDIHEVELEKGQMKATVGRDNKVVKIEWTAELKDNNGRILYFKGEGVHA